MLLIKTVPDSRSRIGPATAVWPCAMRASRSRTRDATDLLTSTPDEAALAIACFLLTARDLLCLRLTCRRFNIRCIVGASGGGAAAAAPEMLCIVEAAGWRWVAACSEQERGCVPHDGVESWLGLMQAEGVLRLPLAYGWAHADITLSEDGAVATRGDNEGYSRGRSAASKAVMRSGCHFAQFTVVEGDDLYFGVIRQDWDVEVRDNEPVEAAGHCFYTTSDGWRFPYCREHWEGMQGAQEPGDRIGMLLDLDQGSKTIWKNDVKLGVMVAEGLKGPLCWAAPLYATGDRVRIESAPLPADA